MLTVHLSEAEKIIEFQCHQEGKARKSFQGIPKKLNTPFMKLLQRWASYFLLLDQLSGLVNWIKQNVRRFANRISTLVDKAYPEYSNDGNECLRIHHFLKVTEEIKKFWFTRRNSKTDHNERYKGF